jgi:hypothetical protein
MTTKIQTFGIHRIVIKPQKHIYQGIASRRNFTALSLELYDVKGERIPTNITLYSAGEQSEVSFAPTETIEHN